VSAPLDRDPRPLSAVDAVGARGVAERMFGGTPYHDRVVELLGLAAQGDIEHQTLIVEHAGSLAGFAIYGEIAGAAGAGRLHVVAVDPAGSAADVGARLVDAVVETLRRAGARFVLAEMPEDPALDGAVGVLRAAGFEQEARIPDLFREGVALVFLRKELG
jgi:ribosomal protein S18 acetylase RimI-like enzyme